MTNYDRLEILKALHYGISDEVILQECDITPDQLHEVRVEFEREGYEDATD